ncbi:MAG: hypothetical protein LBL18_00015, partial [Bacteroidales bacterium]|nr:hypothetical protein [Bacteroidales bacterium]
VGISDKYNNTIGHITYSNRNKGAGGVLYATTQSGYYLNVSICDMGVVSGLAAMKEVPSTGFTSPASVNSVNCVPHHGYIFKFINYNYGEECIVFLYVEKYITSDNNEIIGCEIKYKVQEKDTFYF